jgi:hypothetical protein
MLIISLMTFLLAGTELLQGPGTVPVKIGNAISLQLPASLSLQSAAEINQRYVAARPPLALYSDASGQVDLSVNKAVTRWGEDDYEIMKSFYKSTIMGLYSEVQFITEEIRQIDGRKFVAFEFIGRVIPGEGTTQSESAEGAVFPDTLHHRRRSDRVVQFFPVRAVCRTNGRPAPPPL